ncbi:MAG: hypothetical protein JKY62_05790 [Desulfocapsa sp.]|nr:hypothetical protein [Desulfocapsa sp.]
MKTTILLSVLTIILVISYSIFMRKNPNSNHRSQEKVTIITIKKTCDEEGSTTSRALPAVVVAAIPLTVDFAVNRTVAALRKETALYTAVWSGFKADDNFYCPNDNSSALQEIIIERYAGSLRDEPAFIAKLAVRQSHDGFAFQLIPIAVKINRTKAKLRQNDDDIDVNIHIQIEALYSNNEKIINLDIGRLDIPLRGLELGKEWRQNTPYSVASQWFPAVPVSSSQDSGRTGTGNYVIKVTVEEYDDFGKRVNQISDVLFENKKHLQDFLQPD